MPTTASPVQSPELAPEIAAAIAAAVHFTLGSAAKVTSVTLQAEPVRVDAPSAIWSLEGRRQIYSSHRVR